MSEPVVIITPPVAESDMDLDLVNLTEYIWRTQHADEPYGFGLGGEYGYGPYGGFENDVFEMHEFCWCEREDCRWCGDEQAPNFRHKASGFSVHWYKWIGRSTDTNRDVSPDEWRRIFAECVASV